jgi:hypothetical protein
MVADVKYLRTTTFIPAVNRSISCAQATIILSNITPKLLNATSFPVLLKIMKEIIPIPGRIMI